MKLNKILALSALLVSGFALGACNNETPSESASATPSTTPSVEESQTPSTPSVEESQTPSTPSETPVVPEGKINVGLGYAHSFTEGDLETAAQLDLTAAFVAFNEEGKIVDVRIDVVQVKAAHGEEGLVVKPGTLLNEDESIKTKLELGKDYNMVTYGKAIAEVDAQIEAFADWTVGQTVEGLKANVAAEHGYGVAPHADLAGSVTIVCHDFVAAIEMAWNNKTESTFDKAGQAGIAMVAGLGESYGTWEMSVDVAGVMANEGTVVASQIDAIVLQLSVAEDGAITAKEDQKYLDADGNLLSKKTLGDAYAMRPASPIGVEWDEQAAAIEAAANGKTAAQIEALVAGQGELATATMFIGNYLTALAKAVNYAGLEHVGPQA